MASSGLVFTFLFVLFFAELLVGLIFPVFFLLLAGGLCFGLTAFRKKLFGAVCILLLTLVAILAGLRANGAYQDKVTEEVVRLAIGSSGRNSDRSVINVEAECQEALRNIAGPYTIIKRHWSWGQVKYTLRFESGTSYHFWLWKDISGHWAVTCREYER